MEKAFKYRIYPSKKQKQILAETFGCVRFVQRYQQLKCHTEIRK